ncbi:MAG: bifunctional oligoribonuclease/PAP phosphatase NrnA [Clostridiales bacterium]|nr:bifunctional oligoribonuclease/PAP phosphatase NrnA [Clostridiales bacterium]
MISLSDIAAKLKGEKKVALIAHIRPDGDTLGSALALKLALLNLGIGAEVFCDDVVPSRFLFLNEAKTVKNALDGEYSMMLAIDCADVTRLGGFYTDFAVHKNTAVIDHHVSNTRFAKINYVFDNASNCENVFDLICEMGATINSEIANLLMLGIVTDTGCFKHKNVTEKTLKTAGELKALGADINKIYYHMFSAQSKERAKLFGQTMANIRYFCDEKVAIATVRLSDFERTGARQNETEGFIDFLMGINGVEIGVMIMEYALNKFKISFRSLSADVNAVASSFGGGGHVLASGCQIHGDYEEVVDKIRFACSRELPE